MPSIATGSAFRWIYGTQKNLQVYTIAVDQWKTMGLEANVRQAAVKAGKVIQTEAQDLIFNQNDLSAYQEVAEAFDTWSDDGNVWVGVQAPDVIPEALQMDTVFPVLETAFRLGSAKAIQVFEEALSESAF